MEQEICPLCGEKLTIKQWKDDYWVVEIKKQCSCGYIYHWAYGELQSDSTDRQSVTEPDPYIEYLEAEVCRLSRDYVEDTRHFHNKWMECEERLSQMRKGVDCATAEWSGGKCNGYGRAENDDEPCDQCKVCPKQASYGVE